jgi:hypothetical protein
MSTTALAPEQVLHETMSKLEAALLTPVIAGELPVWIRNVQNAATTFGTDWARYLHTVLHVQYAEIAGADQEMLGFVQQMKKTDQQLLEDYAKFQEDLHELDARAKRIPRQETAVLADHRQRVEDAGIRLIVNIKRQEAAASTWLAEALYRDRGVAD